MDFNIGELTLNRFEMLNIDLFNQYCFIYTKWILNNVVIQLSEDNYKKFLEIISRTPIGRYHILFFIRILFFRFKFIIIFFILKNLLNIRLIKYNYFFLKFVILKIFSFLLRKLNILN